MKKLMLFAVAGFILGAGTIVYAGFSGSSDAKKNVAAQIAQMPDETPVILEGYIEKHLGGEDYLFKDDSGSVKVEIDNKKWGGQTVTPQDKVEIRGEVDTHRFKPEDIEVDSIRLVK